jgi:hypothetical protein
MFQLGDGLAVAIEAFALAHHRLVGHQAERREVGELPRFVGG